MFMMSNIQNIQRYAFHASKKKRQICGLTKSNRKIRKSTENFPLFFWLYHIPKDKFKFGTSFFATVKPCQGLFEPE